jgi:hypothetical protein
MNATNPKSGATVAPPASSPASGTGVKGPGTGVKVVKRQVAPPPQAVREKTCSQCNRPFKLTPEQKFHLCPRCYQKAQAKRPAPPRRGTQVLTQITCSSCGIQEYLTIVPTDPSKALCAACHTANREKAQREPKPDAAHPNPR